MQEVVAVVTATVPKIHGAASGGDLSSQRTPAWCDRVLFRLGQKEDHAESTVEVVEYDSYPLKYTSSLADR